ncbi:hypothetical protein VPHD69_0125 [Vibrio phage D69]
MRILSWFGLSSQGDPRGNLKELEMDNNKDHELYGTYFVVTPDMSTDELTAIQDWAKSHRDITLRSMPIADILTTARGNGKAFIGIDETGLLDSKAGIPHYYRRLDFALSPRVCNYRVEPKTVKVNGKYYDKDELAEAIKHLEPKGEC